MNDIDTATMSPALRAEIALDSSTTEAYLHILATKHASITEAKNKAGRDQAHGATMECARARIAVEKAAKEARDDATKFSKAVIAEAARLVAIVEPEEVRLKAVRDVWDAEQARIKREAEEKERARVLAITERIAAIKAYVVMANNCRTSASVAELKAKLSEVDLLDFEEFTDEAENAFGDAFAHLVSVLADRLAQEEDAARIKAEREAEAARLKAEREELERQQADAKRQADELAAQQKAEDDRLAAERVEFARHQAESAAALAAQQAELERRLSEFRGTAVEVERKVCEAAQPAPDLVDTAADPLPCTPPVEQTEPIDIQLPSASNLIDVVAYEYDVDAATAAQWLAARADEFKQLAEAQQ